MVFGIKKGPAFDIAETPFGALRIESGLFAQRCVGRDEFGEAVIRAHQASWQAGDDQFIYTRAKAQSDMVVAA